MTDEFGERMRRRTAVNDIMRSGNFSLMCFRIMGTVTPITYAAESRRRPCAADPVPKLVT